MSLELTRCLEVMFTSTLSHSSFSLSLSLAVHQNHLIVDDKLGKSWKDEGDLCDKPILLITLQSDNQMVHHGYQKRGKDITKCIINFLIIKFYNSRKKIISQSTILKILPKRCINYIVVNMVTTRWIIFGFYVNIFDRKQHDKALKTSWTDINMNDLIIGQQLSDKA